MASRKVGFGTGLAAGAILLLGIAVFVNRIVRVDLRGPERLASKPKDLG